MIYKATKLIMQEMDRKGIKYSAEDYEDRSIIFAGFGIENGPNVRVQFISLDDDNDVAIRVFRLVNNVAEDKVAKMLEAINECNCEFRFLKFVLDKDRDVNVEFELPQTSDDASVGPQACEMFIRTMKILDKAYPKFMKVIWS